MITRKFPTILTAWRGLIEELAYKTPPSRAVKWGVNACYPDMLQIEIEDILNDDQLETGLASFTKGRWSRFLRTYLRPDFPQWIEAAIARLKECAPRPYVESYSININETPPKLTQSRINYSGGGRRGHNHGSCLSSVQFRLYPKPRVILYSRACCIDKAGLLDLFLMHHLALRVGESIKKEKMPATWILSMGFISAITQVFYTYQFKLPTDTHLLHKAIARFAQQESYSKYGPVRRIRKRKEEFKNHGRVLKSVPVSELSLEF